jgi:hypothetical protein
VVVVDVGRLRAEHLGVEPRSTVELKKAIGCYPSAGIDAAGTQVVSHAGVLLLTETIAVLALTPFCPGALPDGAPGWRCTTRTPNGSSANTPNRPPSPALCGSTSPTRPTQRIPDQHVP